MDALNVKWRFVHKQSKVTFMINSSWISKDEPNT